MKSFTSLVLAIVFSFIVHLGFLDAAEIVSKGFAGDRLIFSVNGVSVAVVPGDMIGECKVSSTGLDCGAATDTQDGSTAEDVLGDVLKLKIDNQNCEESLDKIKQECRGKYKHTIEELTKALRSTNLTLVEKIKEIEEVKKDLQISEVLVTEYSAQLKALGGPGSHAQPVVPVPAEVEQSKVAVGALDDHAQLVSIATASGEIETDALKKETQAEMKKAVPEAKSFDTGSVDLSASGKLTVLVNWSNVRNKAVIGADIVTQGLAGDEFRIIGSNDKWYKVEADDRAVGWISADLVKLSKDSNQAVQAQTMVQVKNGNASVREGPGFHYARNGLAKNEKRYKVVQQTSNWYQVSLESGSKGWIHKSTVIAE